MIVMYDIDGYKFGYKKTGLEYLYIVKLPNSDIKKYTNALEAWTHYENCFTSAVRRRIASMLVAQNCNPATGLPEENNGSN